MGSLEEEKAFLKTIMLGASLWEKVRRESSILSLGNSRRLWGVAMYMSICIF